MPSPFVLIPQYFGSIVFERASARNYPFDRDATGLLQQLTLKRIDQLLSGGLYTADERETIHSFFEHFDSLGWFTPDGRFPADVLAVDPPADYLTGPLAVHLEATSECNLQCSHCFAGEPSSRCNSDAPLSFAELDQLFAELGGIGAFRLGLTGGEPFLRDELIDIIACAIRHELHPCVTTNGLLITPSMAKTLARMQPLRLNVSLEGATAETNDAVRGPGVFQQLLHQLEMLRRHGVPFGLSFTLTKDNAHEVTACARLARKSGAAAAVFRPLYPVGNAAKDLARMPSYSQYAEAMQCLESNGLNEEIHVIDPFSPIGRAETKANIDGPSGCAAARSVASISYDGYVNPCSFLGDSFNAGNIRDSSFTEIWHRGRSFVDLRTDPSESRFRGGCRVRALALGGDLNAADPWCDEYLNYCGKTVH